MRGATRIWFAGQERTTVSLAETVEAATSSHPSAPWELEIGFGKGRYLLRRAQEDPDRLFLGIEIAGQYYRLTRDRAARKGLDNVVLVHGEATARETLEERMTEQGLKVHQAVKGERIDL